MKKNLMLKCYLKANHYIITTENLTTWITFLFAFGGLMRESISMVTWMHFLFCILCTIIFTTFRCRLPYKRSFPASFYSYVTLRINKIIAHGENKDSIMGWHVTSTEFYRFLPNCSIFIK